MFSIKVYIINVGIEKQELKKFLLLYYACSKIFLYERDGGKIIYEKITKRN